VTAARTCAVCGASLDGRRSHAVYCSSSCRGAAWATRRLAAAEKALETLSAGSQRLRDGRIRTPIGPRLTITVPADWPERSARFWNGLAEIVRRDRRDGR
jgi:hypothetical protein